MRHADTKTLTRTMLGMASAIALALPAAPLMAQANVRQQVTIEAQSLDTALVEVGRRYGISVYAASDLTKGKKARRISGNLTASEALTRLLSGSGLTYNRASDGRYIVTRAVPPRPTVESNKPSPPVEPTNEPIIRADTIIVTGTKQNQSIQDTQTSVTVVTSEQIEERGFYNLEDIVLRTPNLSTAGGSLNDISIRGISFNGVGGGGIGVTGNIYVDGAPSNTLANLGALNLWDVEQVEALRGPQSTVQGRNALAGAIVLQTADPEYDFGVDARILIGNENSRQYSAAVTGPIIADQVAFRLSADYREVDFEVVNQLNGDNTRFQEGLTLRGKLLFEPKGLERLRLEITGEYTETDTGALNVVVAPVPISDRAFEDFDPFGDETFANGTVFDSIKTTRFIADLDYEMSDNWSFKALGTYEEADNEAERGALGRNVNIAETYTAELRANFEYDGITGWIGGYFFDTSTDVTRTQTAFPITFFPTVPVGSLQTSIQEVRGISAENYALFGDITFELTDKLKINLGARYDWESLDIGDVVVSFVVDPADCIVNPAVPGIGGQLCSDVLNNTEFLGISSSFEAFLPRGSIIYDFDDDRSLSFTFSRGYRAGGVDFTFVSDSAELLNTYDPEFLNNYELAFRSVWPDAGITFNANVFYSEWTDQQVVVPNTVDNFADNITLNAGESELYGVEFSADAKVTSKLSVFANMGLLWTEFIDFQFAVDANGDPVNPADPQFANLAGNRFNSSPRFNAAAGATYRDDNGVFANTNISYSSAQFSDVQNLPQNRGDDLFLVNARIGYDFGNFSVAAFVDNLFDNRAVLRRNTGGVQPNAGVVVENPRPGFTVNEPRLFGVEARARF
ncbi:MAG: TonB-dependent receptor [Pseudomonadota bacterium]